MIFKIFCCVFLFYPTLYCIFYLIFIPTSPNSSPLSPWSYLWGACAFWGLICVLGLMTTTGRAGRHDNRDLHRNLEKWNVAREKQKVSRIKYNITSLQIIIWYQPKLRGRKRLRSEDNTKWGGSRGKMSYHSAKDLEMWDIKLSFGSGSFRVQNGADCNRGGPENSEAL